ncbi:MAG: hypothetical protein V4710_04700, partial [Verrucomicrobiota bacterium]
APAGCYPPLSTPSLDSSQMSTHWLLTLSLAFLGAAAWHVRARYRWEFIIEEGFTALFYEHDRLIGSLVPGHYIRWGSHCRVTVFDLHHLFPPASETFREELVLAASLLAATKVPHEICKELPLNTSPSRGAAVGGVPLRIFLSERSNPGALLKETILHRPSSRDD